MTYTDQSQTERFVVKFQGEIVARSSRAEGVPSVARHHLHHGEDNLFVVDLLGGGMLPYAKFLEHHQLQ